MSLNLDFSNNDVTDNGLALNLENVNNLDDYDDSSNIDAYLMDKLSASIGLSFAVDSVINARILEAVGDDEYIEEGKSIKKTVVRNGKLTKKLTCKPGYHVDGMDCIKTSTRDAIAFGRRAKKAAKTRARKRPSAQTSKSLKRSLVIRQRNATKVGKK